MDKAIVPKEALAYLKAKGLKVGFHHADVWKEEHNIAFTVAKMMQLDMLQDVKEALNQALEEGQTFSQFAANLKPYLIKKGWWGEQLARDPLDGDIKVVKLGSNARLKTIYRTNMRTARAAGQWERIERTQTTHPFLLYELGPSREHRKEHQAWAGIILPANHPWWQTHMPPNGWGCKCRVRQLSQREADRLIASGQYRTEAPPHEERDWVNKRTGEVERVPRGIDPGWSYHPGSRKEEIRRQFQKTQLNAL
ncbi:phage head morphogenesis protein [Grimontia hollisae]|uniref:phage head morphogenesis protein n=1 Tax=Grimontia hollisae TaxID=673 RepID=UPI00165D6C83|nr:phage minor head protein [Grimontia hollisae]